MHLLLQKKNKTKTDWFFTIYVLLLFTMGNVGNAANIKVGEVIWIDNRNFPGGPNAFYAQGGGPFNNTANVVYIINSWFQDGMLVRFHIFHRNSTRLKNKIRFGGSGCFSPVKAVGIWSFCPGSCSFPLLVRVAVAKIFFF
jgi:hypothetical protein